LKSLAGLTRLARLDLDENKISDAAIPQLVALKGLKLLSIRSTKISRGGTKRLQDALPGCKVQF
jgi:Leucine-rich repeat (LRR) protein